MKMRNEKSELALCVVLFFNLLFMFKVLRGKFVSGYLKQKIKVKGKFVFAHIAYY